MFEFSKNKIFVSWAHHLLPDHVEVRHLTFYISRVNIPVPKYMTVAIGY